MYLLIADLIRRESRAFAAATLATSGLWLVAVSGVLSRNEALGVSLGIAFAVGPFVAVTRLARREIRYLPVAERDLWRTGWVIATLLPTTIALLGMMLALIAPPVRETIGVEALSLTAVLHFAYTGTGFSLIGLFTRRRRDGRAGRIAGGVIDAAIVVVFLGGVGWGYLLRSLLPVKWAHLSPAGALWLASATALTVRAWRCPAALPGRTFTHREASTERISRNTGIAAGLTGLRLLFWNELRFTILIATLAVVPLTFVTVMFPIPLGHLVPWVAVFVAAPTARFPRILRHLRALPIGTPLLNGFLVGWSALVAGTVCAALLALSVIWPAAAIRPLPLAAAIGVAGFAALMHSVFLAWPAALPKILALSGLAAPFVLRVVPQPSLLNIAGMGLVAAALAAVINRRTLTRSATYRRSASSLVQSAMGGA